MSAVAWDLSPSPARSARRPAPPRLVSIPCGERLSAPPAAPLHITRLGRLAITLAVLVVALAVTVASLTGGASPSAPGHATTVQPGQTLSEIAALQLPQLPVADAVARIQIANDLPGSHVHAGQSLVIPAVRGCCGP